MRPLVAADHPRLAALEGLCFPEGPWSPRALDGCWAGPPVGVERGGAQIGYADGRLIADEAEQRRTGGCDEHRKQVL